MLNPIFIKWINGELVKNLEETVDRIPKDLKIWSQAIKKLKFAKTSKKKKQAKEYYKDYVYYVGKMIAYVYVLEKLGDSKFVTQWEKKFKVKYIKTDNCGGTKIVGKW